MRDIAEDAALRGLLRPELFMGLVSSVSASHAQMSLSTAGAPSASHFEAHRYGRGEVGEFVLVEGQLNLTLARLVELRLPEGDRRASSAERAPSPRSDILGVLQLLGTVQFDSLRIAAGVANHPRIGDRVYAAPHAFVGQIPRLQESPTNASDAVTIHLGSVRGAGDAPVDVRPEKVFGRHCAVLGATGGGKSWTVARLLEEASRHRAKVLLFDATSEYRTLSPATCRHIHLGTPIRKADGSLECSLPPTGFLESDFLALFEPAGKVQGPKLQAAIRSLRLAKADPSLASTEGLIEKRNKPRAAIELAARKHATLLEDPATPFAVHLLAKQLRRECVHPDGGTRGNPDNFGDINQSEETMCLPLAARIHVRVTSLAFAPVFQSTAVSFRDHFEAFWHDPEMRVLRVCLGGVSYEHHAREFIVNALGREVLNEARKARFGNRPLLLFVDEAHNFLGRSLGTDETRVYLDAFEIIAREGRKYGLNICLATQRPRDVTEGVLSQIGTLIVHRLTNDRDREIVERACGEIDRSASAFLSSLRAGEAAIIGVDFPIPLTIQVTRPGTPPESDGPNYQRAWAQAPETGLPNNSVVTDGADSTSVT